MSRVFIFSLHWIELGQSPLWIGITAGDKCLESTCFHFSHFSRKIMVASSTGPAGWCRDGSPWCKHVLQGLMESQPALLVSAGQHCSWSQIGNLRVGIADSTPQQSVSWAAVKGEFCFFLQLGSTLIKAKAHKHIWSQEKLRGTELPTKSTFECQGK